MAGKITFHEISGKTEELIERGRQTRQQVQMCTQRVSQCAEAVYQAQMELDRAQKPDSEGRTGDVEGARSRLMMAQERLEANNRALESARTLEAGAISEATGYAQSIRDYASVEQSNLATFRKAGSIAFSQHAARAAAGIAGRINEAEQARIRLLNSLGISDTATRVSADIDGAAQADFSGLTGASGLEYLGMDHLSSEGILNEESRLAVLTGKDPDFRHEQDLQYLQALRELGMESAFDQYLNLPADADGQAMREKMLAEMGIALSRDEARRLREQARGREMSSREKYDRGLRYVENILDVYRDNLKDRGFPEGPALDAAEQELHYALLEQMGLELQGKENRFYDDAYFMELIRNMSPSELPVPGGLPTTEVQRQAIRRGIRDGSLTEKDIRGIGRSFSDYHDARCRSLQKKNLQTYREELALTKAFMTATAEQQQSLELQRQLLIRRENLLYRQQSNEKGFAGTLAFLRPVGPQDENSRQCYTIGGASAGEVARTINHVRTCLPRDWVEKGNSRPLRVLHTDRGYFCSGTWSDTIALSGGQKHMTTCGFHEMGHRMEAMFPEILTLEKQFYNRRTQGEPLRPLGKPYDASEMARVDHFLTGYIGKDYGGNGYEILSMGLESVYRGSYDLNRDPEFRDLIYGILAAC